MLLQRIFLNSHFRWQKWLFKGKKRGLLELYHYDFRRIVLSDPKQKLFGEGNEWKE